MTLLVPNNWQIVPAGTTRLPTICWSDMLPEQVVVGVGPAMALEATIAAVAQRELLLDDKVEAQRRDFRV